MFEQQLETYVFQFTDFIFGICGRIINFCIGWGLFFGLCYFICRYLVCGNDKSELKEIREMFGSAIKNCVESFKIVMPAVKESAKCWAEEKIDSLSKK